MQPHVIQSKKVYKQPRGPYILDFCLVSLSPSFCCYNLMFPVLRHAHPNNLGWVTNTDFLSLQQEWLLSSRTQSGKLCAFVHFCLITFLFLLIIVLLVQKSKGLNGPPTHLFIAFAMRIPFNGPRYPNGVRRGKEKKKRIEMVSRDMKGT